MNTKEFISKPWFSLKKHPFLIFSIMRKKDTPKFNFLNLTGFNCGFSLLEVVTSLFILSVILALTSLSFLHFSPKYKLKRAVWEINSSLNFARYKAIWERTKIRIRFYPQSYTIDQYDQQENQWKTKQTHSLEGVLIKANNSPTFHPQGTVSNLASIYISNSWGMYKITLAISGRIKVVLI